MCKFIDSFKAFSIPYETWYADTSVKPILPNPFLMVGYYHENDSTDGEFQIEWNPVGIRLKSFSDSWEALSKMPELIAYLAEIDRNEEELTIHEFAERLKEMGYRDITERVKEK